MRARELLVIQEKTKVYMLSVQNKIYPIAAFVENLNASKPFGHPLLLRTGQLLGGKLTSDKKGLSLPTRASISEGTSFLGGAFSRNARGFERLDTGSRDSLSGSRRLRPCTSVLQHSSILDAVRP